MEKTIVPSDGFHDCRFFWEEGEVFAQFFVFRVSTAEFFFVRSLDQEWRMKDHKPMKRDEKTW